MYFLNYLTHVQFVNIQLVGKEICLVCYFFSVLQPLQSNTLQTCFYQSSQNGNKEIRCFLNIQIFDTENPQKNL